jgi:predicted phage baseplate assembly protein
VSDPGVTLIETFAYMTDLLLYRLNRVPDKLYIKFLELLGVRMFPPPPARTDVALWPPAPALTVMDLPAWTQVSTVRTETQEPVVFSTAADLRIQPCSLLFVGTMGNDGPYVDRTDTMRIGTSFPCFTEVPVVGDCVLVALDEAVPSNAVRLSLDCRIEGVGVDPDNPPLLWEAYDGATWAPCELARDTTGGLNRAGEITVHVPASHTPAVLEGVRAGWLRARVVAALDGQPEYSSSPTIRSCEAGTVGGTVDAIHADLVDQELLGTSDGVAGQRYQLAKAPILSGAGDPVLEVSDDEEGWQEWEPVQIFYQSGPGDRHYILDHATGEVQFGPAVRLADGTIRQYGAVPPAGSSIRMRRYAVGGGTTGNVGAGALRTLRTTIPFVSAVENRHPAVGGVAGETVDEVKVRGPITVRTRARAVTADDYEFLTREAAPEIARVRCVTAPDSAQAGTVKLLVVPAAPVDRGRIRFEDLVPTTETLEKLAAALDRARLIGTRLLIEPPLYQGLTVVAVLKARPRANVARIENEARERLETYFNPLVGGPSGTGWPFGRPVQAAEAFSVLSGIRGVEVVEDIRLFGANPVSGERGQATQRLELPADGLVFSYGHQVRVQEA